jgi:hypothetical protein
VVADVRLVGSISGRAADDEVSFSLTLVER